jgi:hypothetical protein
LTPYYSTSYSFVIKSTNPSFVGGDSRDTSTEEERQKVDRIAFSGIVPVNVCNANIGDYIVPIPILSNDMIGGIPVPDSNCTFEQYRKAVGKVISILQDGRPSVIVKTI